MYSKNRKRGYLLSAALTSVLMVGGVTVAEEYVAAGPVLALGLQAKVQAALSQQIEYEVPATVAEHIAQQEFDQMLADTANIDCEKVDRDTSLAANLPHEKKKGQKTAIQN